MISDEREKKLQIIRKILSTPSDRRRKCGLARYTSQPKERGRGEHRQPIIIMSATLKTKSSSNNRQEHTTGRVQHWAVRPLEAQDAANSSLVSGSSEAVGRSKSALAFHFHSSLFEGLRVVFGTYETRR